MFASFIAYVRRHHVAYIALLVALGGTAYAIENDSVRSRHIKDNQVKPVDLGAVKTIEAPAQNSVPAGAEETVGEVSFGVPEPGLVAVMAAAEIRLNFEDGFDYCALSVDTGATDQRLLAEIADLDVLRERFSAPATRNDGTIAASTQWSDGGWTLIEVEPGRTTFSVELNAFAGYSCDFANVRVYMAPVG